MNLIINGNLNLILNTLKTLEARLAPPVFAEVMRRLACGGMHESVREGSLSG